MTQSQNTSSTVGQIDKEVALSQLSPHSHYPTEDNWDEAAYNGQSQISMTTAPEQLIRAAVIMGAHNKICTELVDTVTNSLKQHEDTNLWNIEHDPNTPPESTGRHTGNTQQPKHVKTDISADSTDPQLRETLATIRSDEADLRENRRYWYDNIASDLLSKQPHRGKNDSIDKYFQPRIIHNGSPLDAVAQLTKTDSTELTQLNHESVPCIHINECDGKDLTKHGFSLPLPAIICRSWSSGNVYPFVPWCGVATCTCGTHNDPTATLCKHEILALEKFQNSWPPKTMSMPSRFTRLFAPQAYSHWMDEKP